MMKKSLVALAALGLVGAISLTTSATPVHAGLICGPKAMAKDGGWCQRAAEKRAARQAKWKSFWSSRKKR